MLKDEDTFQKFLFEELQIRGEWARLGQSFDKATENIEYPVRLKSLVGQVAAASVLLTGTLKFAGRLSIHARGQGPISLLMAEATHKRTYRAIAHWSDVAERQEGSGGYQTLKDYIGNAQLVITIDPDQGQRYQGIVPLERDTLGDCLALYFELSEQLDTYFMLGSDERGAFGLMLQKLPEYRNIQDQDAWDRVVHLARTLSMDELVANDNETLMTRLFHEEQVRVFDKESVAFECTCSKARTLASIESLGKDEAMSILNENECIEVDCQFCAARYTFERDEVEKIFGISGLQ